MPMPVAQQCFLGGALLPPLLRGAQHDLVVRAGMPPFQACNLGVWRGGIQGASGTGSCTRDQGAGVEVRGPPGSKAQLRGTVAGVPMCVPKIGTPRHPPHDFPAAAC